MVGAIVAAAVVSRRAIAACGCAALLALGACAHSHEFDRLRARYPGARYESRTQGCATVGLHGRDFGRDIRLAILAARQEVRNARYYPCEALIVAKVDGAEHPLYRLSLTRDGKYIERELRESA
jgi:hypothetical protein